MLDLSAACLARNRLPVACLGQAGGQPDKRTCAPQVERRAPGRLRGPVRLLLLARWGRLRAAAVAAATRSCR